MPGHTVTVYPGVPTGQTSFRDGTLFYQWMYIVVVDGQAGTYTDLVDTNDPGEEPGLRDTIVHELENDPSYFFHRDWIDPDLLDSNIAQNDAPADDGASDLLDPEVDPLRRGRRVRGGRHGRGGICR